MRSYEVLLVFCVFKVSRCFQKSWRPMLWVFFLGEHPQKKQTQEGPKVEHLKPACAAPGGSVIPGCVCVWVCVCEQLLAY